MRYLSHRRGLGYTSAMAGSVRLEFPVVKLLDYAPQWPALEADPNPFATVVLAHLKTLETRRSPARIGRCARAMLLRWTVRGRLTRMAVH